MTDDPSRPYRLAGAAEVASILGVTKQRVHQLREAGRLPAPVAVLAATAVWDREAMESYAATRCRCGTHSGKQHAATCPAHSDQEVPTLTCALCHGTFPFTEYDQHPCPYMDSSDHTCEDKT